MNEAAATRRAARRIVFVVLCLALMLIRLLPLGSSGWPAPDVMLCLVIAWSLRRPEDLPTMLLAPVLLLADLLLMRPPGLWALLVLTACEFLHRRRLRTRSLPFAGEMALVALLLTGIVFAHWAVLSLLFVDQTGLASQLWQVPVTLAAYPVVVLVMHYVFGIRKRPAPEGFGKRVTA